jgi:hypothetical protein
MGNKVINQVCHFWCSSCFEGVYHIVVVEACRVIVGVTVLLFKFIVLLLVEGVHHVVVD